MLLGLLAGKDIRGPDKAKTVLRNLAGVQGLSLITQEQVKQLIRDIMPMTTEELEMFAVEPKLDFEDQQVSSS